MDEMIVIAAGLVAVLLTLAYCLGCKLGARAASKGVCTALKSMADAYRKFETNDNVPPVVKIQVRYRREACQEVIEAYRKVFK